MTLERFATVTPRPIEQLVAVAVGLANAGRAAEARLVCEKAVETHPPHPAILQLLALFALPQDPAAALAHAQASLALRPDHAPTLRLAAQAAMGSGDADAAGRAWGRLVELGPGEVEAWFGLAQARQDAGDLDGAAVALDHVTTLDPARAEAWVNLGIVRQAQRRLDDALRAYGRALRLRPETFGRIAHALATPSCGRLWLDLEALRAELLAAGA